MWAVTIQKLIQGNYWNGALGVGMCIGLVSVTYFESPASATLFRPDDGTSSPYFHFSFISRNNFDLSYFKIPSHEVFSDSAPSQELSFMEGLGWESPSSCFDPSNQKWVSSMDKDYPLCRSQEVRGHIQHTSTPFSHVPTLIPNGPGTYEYKLNLSF